MEGAMEMQRGVRLAVLEAGEERLVYAFQSAGEAAEMIGFLREFWPAAEFVVEPLLN